MHDEAIGPETRALFTTRRWLDTMLALLVVAVTAARAMPDWPRLSSVEHAGLIVGVVLVLSGAVLGSKSQYLWLCPAGLGVLSLTALLAPHGSPAWIPMPNVASYAAYIAMTLVSRRIGLALIFVGPALVEIIWLSQPTNIVATGMALWGGWLVAGQVLATCLATWWAWNKLLVEAGSSDRDFHEREIRAEQSLTDQERARVWRSAVARVHESLLNTIRYAVETTHLDRDRLSAELARPTVPPELTSTLAAATPELLLREVLQDPVAARILQLPDTYADFEMSPEVFTATRNALVELAHNSARHGMATELRTSFEVDEHGTLTVKAIDNGSGIKTWSQPGFGSTRVLQESLATVGGSVSLNPGLNRGVEARITVPVTSEEAHQQSPAIDTSFDQGRYLFTAPLSAGAAWGIIYFLMLGSLRSLDRTGGYHFWLTIIFGIVGSATAAYVAWRRYRPPMITGFILTMIPALVPWFLRTSDYACANVPNVAAVLNIAGFAMIAIALWTGYLPGAAAVITWVIGAQLTLQGIPPACQGTVRLAVANSTLILPIAAITTYVGFRSYQRAAERVNQMRKREVIEASRATTAADLNSELYVAVDEATELLTRVAEGGSLDNSSRLRLEVVDAKIRAAIQVDPAFAGGFARSVKRVVDLAASIGVPVSVRAISPSSDPRPLPPGFEDLLASAIGNTTTLRPTIQVFNDGRNDFISIMIDGEGLAAAGLESTTSVTVNDVDLHVMEEDEQDEITAFSVLVSRPAEI